MSQQYAYVGPEEPYIWECLGCSAVVVSMSKHDEFHDRIEPQVVTTYFHDPHVAF